MNGSNQHGIAFQKTPSRISCAITTAIDGSEDDAIHCFKTGQPCGNGRQELMKEMERNRVDDSDDDPFAAEVDDEEVEKNEACIESDDEDSADSECSDIDV